MFAGDRLYSRQARSARSMTDPRKKWAWPGWKPPLNADGGGRRRIAATGPERPADALVGTVSFESTQVVKLSPTMTANDPFAAVIRIANSKTPARGLLQTERSRRGGLTSRMTNSPANRATPPSQPERPGFSHALLRPCEASDRALDRCEGDEGGEGIGEFS